MLTLNKQKFNNDNYDPGKAVFIRIIWIFIDAIFLKNPISLINSIKVFLLRFFGATIGVRCIIKPGVSIKYPWKLTIGDYVGIGENVWIDNLDQVIIGNNVTISQGAMLLTGNHDYKSTSWDLIVKPIMLEDGVWVGARSTVCPGVTMASHSILSVGSILTRDTEEYGIYAGNPAQYKKKRVFVK